MCCSHCLTYSSSRPQPTPVGSFRFQWNITCSGSQGWGAGVYRVVVTRPRLNRVSLVQCPALPLPSQVTWGKLFTLSVPSGFHLS